MANRIKQSTHFCAGIRYRVTSDGRIQFLVINYQEVDRQEIQIKFPGGTNDGRPGESCVETLGREWGEEVGGTELHSALPIFEHPASDNHIKVFYLLDSDDWPEEGMRTGEKVEKGEKGRPDEILSPPRWEYEEDLRQNIFRSHKPSLEKACEWIRTNHPTFKEMH